MQGTTAVEPSGAPMSRLTAGLRGRVSGEAQGREARWRLGPGAGLVIAIALLALGAAALESLPLAQSPPSPRAQAEPGQALHGLDALPLAARGVVARTLGADDRRWLAHSVAGGFALGNRNAAVRASFSRRNAVVRSGTLSWSLGLRGYGYGDRLRSVRPAPPAARANRVVYRRGGVAEWYAGGPLGVEQGFTFTRPPSGSREGPLTLSMGRLPHGVIARVGADHRGLVLAAGGRDLLRYGSLFASDAQGRSLPARVEVSGGSLRLLIDDRGAKYPLQVDPLAQAAKLTASGGGLGDQLGFSVAVSGDGSTAVAGAPHATVDSNANQGLVYVFTHGASWTSTTQTATLGAFDGGAGDEIGASVAISADGSKIVAGAPHSPTGAGAAYVFARPGGGWSGSAEESAKLTASDAAANDLFGSSIAISGNGSTIVGGAPQAAIGADAGQGAAYVFAQPGGGWGSGAQPQHQAAKLTVSDGAAHDGLGGDNGGSAVAVSSDGSTVAAGAATATATDCLPGPCTFGPGAVYVFVKPGGSWSDGTETAKLTASDGQGNDRFGDAVAMASNGSAIVAGAWQAVVNSNSKQGAVYVFVKPGGGWSNGTQTAKLTASDGHGDDRLGRSVAVSSDASTVVAGAYFATVGSNAAQGKVYTFARPAGGWTTGTAAGGLTAVDGAPSDELGFSVAAASDGSTILAGARFASPVQSLQGAAYVFAPAPSNPNGPPQVLLPGGAVGGGGGGGTVGHASVFPTSFPAASSGPSAAAARKFGTKVTFTLDQAANVRFTIQQPRPGRRVKHGKKTTCDLPTKKNAKRKRCTRLVTLKGSFARAGLAGTNTFHFTGRLNGKSLRPGKYKLVATPTANGQIGRAATAAFRIIR
jgi:hypothetical protein